MNGSEARLPRAHLREADTKDLPRRVWGRLRDSDVLGQSAKLSFYLLLAMFPLLLILMSMIGLLLQSETLPQAVLNRYLSGVLPESALALVACSSSPSA